jgi:hypothetical protein
MIHGGAVSIGCIAVGDEAIEDLFVLAHDTGISRIQVIIAPVDFRVTHIPGNAPATPAWVRGLYQRIKSELQEFPSPSENPALHTGP